MKPANQRAFWSLAAAAVTALVACGGGDEPADQPASSYVATILNFISPDPLSGENGLPTSPAITNNYGGINLVMDVDGDAVEATRENDIRFFEGAYYLYGTSQSCGSFDYSPVVSMAPLSNTTPASRYRYCGLAIYKSDDLMHWKLAARVLPQDPSTGKVYAVKKPRVVYAPSTRDYVMWVHDKGSEGDGTPRIKIMTASTPIGPWSAPTSPVNSMTVDEADLYPDMSINVGPDGSAWMATSHGAFNGGSDAVNLWRLTDDRRGVAAKSVMQPDTGNLFGGIGLSYHNGWWYLTGTPICGNCIAARFGYAMARDPFGPWISPASGSNASPVVVTTLSTTSGNAQPVGAVMLPDRNGNTNVLVTLARYRSSATAAPGTTLSQSGDDNFALAGLFMVPLTYDSSGQILPLDIQPTYSFPIANPKAAEAPTPYQAQLAISSTGSVSQTWTVAAGSAPIASLMPSVFQRTPDSSRGNNRSPVNAPMLDAPLRATLELPDGQIYSWSIDPHNVAWAPHRVPLNLPTPFTGGGRIKLTLSTSATNGSYGVAVGPSTLTDGQYAVTSSGVSKGYPSAGMYIGISSTAAAGPTITAQPRSVTASAGTEVGFAVMTDGVGVGYQWQRNGVDIPSPSGLANEATAPSLRLSNVTAADAGVYTVIVSNPVGTVTSIPVQLVVNP
ncbi:MAG: family 43 glycosylhydrolase [Burkholderiales bacterium]|nr:family 43 glycosylhydrolase [Burkholderiales bacterium]